ncbi:MAG: hypothetical protein JNM10_06980 [Planctomycetia bacterium]|nr:hypothetical protein [Planctomycetia bacterium]
MDAEARPPLSAALAARVAGLWIVAGCLLKALLGTPADLPPLVRSLPLPLATTFALVLGVEAFVGLGTLLRPGRFWPLAALLLLAFAGVLVSQVTAGAASCGCFGATITVPPWVMLAVDLAMLALLLGARPWRLARGGRLDVLVGLLALAVGAALPIVLNREARPGDPGGGVLPKYIVPDVPSWVGRHVQDTDVGVWGKLENPRDGLWILYRDSCEVCAVCLQIIATQDRGEREITLVRIPEKATSATSRHVHVLPQGGFVHHVRLPDGVDWSVSTPVRLDVEGGIVKSAREGIPSDDCIPGR